MKEKLRFLGLDVHAETIAVAVAEPDGEVRSLGTIPNRGESIRKMIKKLGPAERVRACYEAGPTGYVVYWQLAELGIQCEVVAPTLVPVKVGDRVKTDRRDAEKLARCYCSGDLTAVWVPDEGSEALRDLVRAREAAKQDQMRARHRLSKFLLRSGPGAAEEVIAFLQKHMTREAVIGSVKRTDVWTYPVVAVREAIMNAIVHADYAQRGAPIRVALFDDRLEVENPGLLPFGLTIDDIQRGISKLRNRVIGRVFQELGLIEQWGSGIQP